MSEDPEFNRLFRKQVNLYRLQELVDSLVMGAKGSHFSFSEDVIKRLHHVAMRGLLNPAGEYRVSPVTITNSPHQPPPWVDVPVHMAKVHRIHCRNVIHYRRMGYPIPDWEEIDF